MVHTATYSVSTGFLSQGQSGRIVKLAAHLHLVSSIRMSGVYLCPPICLRGMDRDNLNVLTIMGDIQGDSWFVDVTAGDDFLGLWDQKASYKHVSDFGRLWSYGRFELVMDSKYYLK